METNAGGKRNEANSMIESKKQGSEPYVTSEDS